MEYIKVYNNINKPRLFSVLIFFILVLSILFFRLLYLQIIKSSKFSKIAYEQHNILIELEPRRGTIYDTNMGKLAFNIPCNSVFANPREIKSKVETAEKLSNILNIDKMQTLEKLKKDKAFVWIARKISEENAYKIKGLKLKGVDLIKESKRCYPNGELAAQLIGFAGLDNKGLEGLEMLFDGYLRGKEGYRFSFQDAKGREVISDKTRILPPVNGLNIVLTIDEVIQNISQKALKKAYEKHNASGAMLIVMDPHTGEILALANEPGYDLNRFKSSLTEARRNRCVTDFFEPGSVFKVVTASALLQKKLVKLDDVFFCENGEYPVAGHVLHDHRPHGNLTFRKVIELSSNIGVIKVASRLSKNDMYNYTRAFGFGMPTGVEMPGEVKGVIRPVNQWSKTSMTAIPMGQEVTTTALQLASCISAIANDGILMKPMIVKKIIDENGEVIIESKPKKVRAVLSKETAKTMQEILAGAVAEGTGKKAALLEYTSAGKTGTAQKVEPNGVYSHSLFVGTFIGFAPVDNPRIAIAVSLDEPHPVYYGGEVAAPVFKEIGDQVLRYLKVPPDKKVETKTSVYNTEVFD